MKPGSLTETSATRYMDKNSTRHFVGCPLGVAEISFSWENLESGYRMGRIKRPSNEVACGQRQPPVNMYQGRRGTFNAFTCGQHLLETLTGLKVLLSARQSPTGLQATDHDLDFRAHVPPPDHEFDCFGRCTEDLQVGGPIEIRSFSYYDVFLLYPWVSLKQYTSSADTRAPLLMGCFLTNFPDERSLSRDRLPSVLAPNDLEGDLQTSVSPNAKDLARCVQTFL